MTNESETRERASDADASETFSAALTSDDDTGSRAGVLGAVVLLVLVAVGAWLFLQSEPPASPRGRGNPYSRPFAVPDVPVDLQGVIGRTPDEIAATFGAAFAHDGACDVYDLGVAFAVCFEDGHSVALEVRAEHAPRSVPRIARWLGLPPYGAWAVAGRRYHAATSTDGVDVVRIEPAPDASPLPERAAAVPAAAAPPPKPMALTDTAATIVRTFPTFPAGLTAGCRSEARGAGSELACAASTGAKALVELDAAGTARTASVIDPPHVTNAAQCFDWLVRAVPGLTTRATSANGFSRAFRRQQLDYAARWHPSAGKGTCELAVCAAGADGCAL